MSPKKEVPHTLCAARGMRAVRSLRHPPEKEVSHAISRLILHAAWAVCSAEVAARTGSWLAGACSGQRDFNDERTGSRKRVPHEFAGRQRAAVGCKRNEKRTAGSEQQTAGSERRHGEQRAGGGQQETSVERQAARGELYAADAGGYGAQGLAINRVR